MDVQVIHLLVFNAYENYKLSLRAALRGDEKSMKWHKDFKSGDLVMEITTMRNRANDKDRIGYLLERGLDQYLIKTLDGRELTWGNADFIRIPDSEFQMTRELNL